MKQFFNLVPGGIVFALFSTMLIQTETVLAQVCSDPSNVIYGLNNAGFIHPVTVSTGLVGAQLNPAYSGNAPASSNGIGYNQLNGNFYYFKRTPSSTIQEFVSFNPATNAVTILANCPTTNSVYVGCLTNDGTGYYCWDSQANVYYYSVSANAWTFITNVIVDQAGADITAVLKANGSGDAAIDGKGNLLLFPSSTSKYALFQLNAPLPKTTLASVTVTGLVPLTTPPSGYKFGGIAFNASGQIIISTATPSNRLYRLENNLTLTFVSTLTSEMGDLTSCNFPLVVLPVKVKKFTANGSNGQVSVKWEVAGSSDVSGYHVQHSVNGKIWQDLTYKSHDDGIVSYSYTHVNPGKGFNYYRLAYASANQEKKYTATKTVNMENESVYVVYPNPMKHRLNMEVNTTRNNPVKAVIYDHTGKVIIEHCLVPGMNTVDVKFLPAGLYVVSITLTSGETHHQKLIKE